MKKTNRLSLTQIEKLKLNELIASAPTIQKVLYKLISTPGAMTQPDYPRLNPLLFLVDEFVNRSSKSNETIIEHSNSLDSVKDET